jgi:hypothetical protein
LPSLEERDEYEGAIIAAGAVHGSLLRAGTDVELVAPDGVATNRLRVRFELLNSPYVITVERDREDGPPTAKAPTDESDDGADESDDGARDVAGDGND